MAIAQSPATCIRSIATLLLLLSALPVIAQQIPVQPVCLTPWLMDRHAHPERKDRRLEALSAGISGERPTMQRELVTPQGHFRIHYDVSGSDAVAARDINGNSIPDFIDSASFYLEVAWEVEINELGYRPPTDNGVQGPEIDVFVNALSPEVYGYAFPEYDIVISNDPLRVGGYLQIDNDYVGYPTAGIAGLKVTTAHEFHHIVQFASYRIESAQLSLYEATSTWMEKAVHPSVKDYRNYTDRFLTNPGPQDYPFSTHDVSNLATGYAHILYLDYLKERIGRDVIRRIWEEFARDDRSFTAIDNALRATSDLNLEKSWCEFALWCYYTGTRAPTDSSYLDEARSLPTMKASMVRSLDDAEETVIDGTLQPLAFALDRVTRIGSNQNIRDTIDFLVTNSRSDIGKGGPQLPSERFTLSVRKEAASGYTALTRGDATIAYYKFNSSSSNFCVDPILGGVRSVTLAVRTAPQPFVNDGANEMVLAVGTPSEQVSLVHVWIYTSSMSRVREITQTSLLGLNNLLGVIWDGRDNDGRLVPSGVYIYQLSLNGGDPTLGKFAVVSR